MIKRTVDVMAAAVGLLVLSPLCLLAALLVKIDSRGPVLFKQERVGRRFQPFTLYKFRTMVDNAQRQGGSITADRDPRVTRVGRILRRTKIDELPQLINVLKGDMSLVGPRPEVDCYVQLFREEYAVILESRPGLTDLASLAYANEEQVLARASDPDEEYRRCVLPHKIRLAKESIDRSSLLFDIQIILRTVLAVAIRR